jgi:uncharacterized repeat protein (TIGR02543 family)
MVNNIIGTREYDYGRTTTIWGEPITDLGGNIIMVGGIKNIFAYDDLLPREAGNNGPQIGSSFFQAELITIPILPGGSADGEGVSYAGTPPTDQRGKDRTNGAPDIGSVCIDSAAFFSNGGWWEAAYSYGDYTPSEPWVFSNPEGINYNELIATSENEEDKIQLPPYYQWMLAHNELRFLGWSTTDGPGLPDIKYVYFLDWIVEDLADRGFEVGEFETDGTYFAKWGEEFLVLYIPDNGFSPVLQPWGTPAPTYSSGNVVLSGWSVNGIDPWDPEIPLDYNEVVYGQWQTNPPIGTFTVEFRDGARSNTVNVPFGGTVPMPADPVREGEVFMGWFTAQEGGTEWDFSTHITSNLVLYAHWDGLVLFIVTFDPCNGDAAVETKIEKGHTCPVPIAIPMREGYAFLGWFTASTGGSQWDFDTPITEDIVLYAQWGEVTENSIIFYPCNGDPPTIIEFKPGMNLSPPLDPAMKGFTFLGWFTAEEGGKKWDPSMPITPGMRFYAQWAAAEDGEGGWMDGEESVIIIVVVVASLVASLGTVPMAFAGGAMTSQVATANVFQQGMQSQHTQSGDRSGEEKNRRSVVFDPRNGRSSWASSVMGGRQVNRPSDPRPPKGMKFSHWSESPEGAPFSFMTPINKNTHLYGVYVKKD